LPVIRDLPKGCLKILAGLHTNHSPCTFTAPPCTLPPNHVGGLLFRLRQGPHHILSRSCRSWPGRMRHSGPARMQQAAGGLGTAGGGAFDDESGGLGVLFPLPSSSPTRSPRRRCRRCGHHRTRRRVAHALCPQRWRGPDPGDAFKAAVRRGQ